jgi:hypothetical protein
VIDLDLRSCDFTSGGCTDADCNYCYGGGRDDTAAGWRWTLVHNFVIGAALCRSYDLKSSAHTWWPGCGKVAL